MAKLINGDGNKAIWAQQDADLIAALTGNVTGIAKVGNKFAATQEDANTLGLSDGVIVTKEGRRIQLDVGNVDLFDIPTGTAGVTSYYIIGYHLITNSDSSQTCETFVQKMDNATDVITENTFRGGATEVYVSCYRVVQDGLNIDSINALLPELENISTLMSALANISMTDYSTENPVTKTLPFTTNKGGYFYASGSVVAPGNGRIIISITSPNNTTFYDTAFSSGVGSVVHLATFVPKGWTVGTFTPENINTFSLTYKFAEFVVN